VAFSVTNFLIAFVVFLLTHSLPSLGIIRQRLIDRFGRKIYMIGYSLLSLASLAWLFYAFMTADEVTLWMDHAWQAWVTLVLAPIGMCLVVCGLLSPNPSSISFRGAGRVGAIVSITRHPVLWGFFLIAFGHIFPNGELSGFILFGGFSVFALTGIVILERRARRRLGAGWGEIAAITSVVPFAAIFAGRARLRVDGVMSLSLAATAIVTGLLLFAFHEVLFGVDPLLLALYGV
jgi:uncharacterized membrane protein